MLDSKKERPDFLKNKTGNDINWDKLTKDDTVAEEEVDLSNTHAIPPPQSYEPQTDNLKPTLGDNSDNTSGGGKGGEKRSSTDSASEGKR